MNKKIIIDANFPKETRVVLLSSTNIIESIEYETAAKQKNKGNIYLAKITRIEPSLQAVFIEYGIDKSGFLPFSEIHPNYFNVQGDKKLPPNGIPEILLSEDNFDEIEEIPQAQKYNSLIDNEEIDLKIIEELVDKKIQSEFNLEIAENDIEVIASPKKETYQHKHYKIQEVIKKGQTLLVQVTKEERGNKGASFTTYLSLAGKYCVLMPNTDSQNGVSRKISNVDERKRLKDIVSRLTKDNFKSSSSIIVRTAGKGCTSLDIKRDYDYLVRLWNKIRESAIKVKAPCFVHEEDGIIRKAIRDMWDYTVKEVLIQGSAAYQSALKFISDISPTELSKLQEHKGKVPIFTKFQVEDQLSKLYQPVVNLTSGGYIVINPTEALISIDVNSGKATSEKNIEETALKTNLEAAKEIARQIKLRDLSGLIVTDFIDMEEARNRKIIERSFKEFLSRDKARIQTSPISQFGLLEISRQRLRASFLEVNSTICSHCNGKGLVRAEESNVMLILRTVENEIFDENIDVVNVFANISSVIYLLNNKRQEISLIEEKYNIKLNFYSDAMATSDNYSIEKIKLPKKNNISELISKPIIETNSTSYIEEVNEVPESLRRNKQKWKNNNRSASNVSASVSVPSENTVSEVNVGEESSVQEEVTNKAPAKRRYRNKKPYRAVAKEKNLVPTPHVNVE